MAQHTPPSGGRGVRRIQAPSRLTYGVLGNPTEYQGQNYGGQVGGPHGYQVGGTHGYQVGGPHGYQVAGPHGFQVVDHHGSQAGDHHVSQAGDYHVSQGGDHHVRHGGDHHSSQGGNHHISQGGDHHGSQAGDHHVAVAKTVKTTASSTALRLRQNELEAKKKIDDLEDLIAEKKSELRIAKSKLSRAQNRLEVLKKKTDSAAEQEATDLELQIVDLQANLDILYDDIADLNLKAERKKALILEEKSVNEDIILEEEHSSPSSVPSKEKKENVQVWLQQQQFHKEDEWPVHPAPPVPTSPTENAVVNQLVSALGQAFGNGHHRSIVTKQVDKDLPVFTGKPEDWLTFISEYERISQKYKYDDSENVIRLRKFLKVPANKKEYFNFMPQFPQKIPKIPKTI